MNGLEAIIAARALLADITPLRQDCGRICGGACCAPDEDGQGGMLLFPGEEALYDPLPEGFAITADDAVMPGARLITCAGQCSRCERPLSCRLFPLLPTRKGCKMDRRAWAVCPLMEWGKSGLSQDFVQAVKKAGEILYASPACADLLDAIHQFNDHLSQF
ncbi:MAG: hypothetical protein E7324_03780 [Clostridiales bacterium]|nr:hypothetical protein [Clostridiales bacterium]